MRGPTFAFHSPRVTLAPAQFRTSCPKSSGSGLSTGRPLMPTIKSYQGSIASSRFEFRRIWKPNSPARFWGCAGTSPSSREMKRFSALNMASARCGERRGQGAG